KNLYRFHLQGTPWEPSVWFASERTLVITLNSEDMESVPFDPRRDTDHLPPAMKRLLEEKGGQGAQLFMVGDFGAWESASSRLLLQSFPVQDRERIKGVQSLGLWVHADNGLTISAALDCSTPDAAQSAAEFIEGRFGKIDKRI